MMTRRWVLSHVLLVPSAESMTRVVVFVAWVVDVAGEDSEVPLVEQVEGTSWLSKLYSPGTE